MFLIGHEFTSYEVFWTRTRLSQARVPQVTGPPGGGAPGPEVAHGGRGRLQECDLPRGGAVSAGPKGFGGGVGRDGWVRQVERCWVVTFGRFLEVKERI